MAKTPNDPVSQPAQPPASPPVNPNPVVPTPPDPSPKKAAPAPKPIEITMDPNHQNTADMIEQKKAGTDSFKFGAAGCPACKGAEYTGGVAANQHIMAICCRCGCVYSRGLIIS